MYMDEMGDVPIADGAVWVRSADGRGYSERRSSYGQSPDFPDATVIPSHKGDHGGKYCPTKKSIVRAKLAEEAAAQSGGVRELPKDPMMRQIIVSKQAQRTAAVTPEHVPGPVDLSNLISREQQEDQMATKTNDETETKKRLTLKSLQADMDARDAAHTSALENLGGQVAAVHNSIGQIADYLTQQAAASAAQADEAEIEPVAAPESPQEPSNPVDPYADPHPPRSAPSEPLEASAAVLPPKVRVSITDKQQDVRYETWYHYMSMQEHNGMLVVTLGFDTRYKGASRTFPPPRVDDGSLTYPYVIDVQGSEVEDQGRFCVWHPDIAHVYNDMEFTILIALSEDELNEFGARVTKAAEANGQ
jgi:hypothetical protein